MRFKNPVFPGPFRWHCELFCLSYLPTEQESATAQAAHVAQGSLCAIPQIAQRTQTRQRTQCIGKSKNPRTTKEKRCFWICIQLHIKIPRGSIPLTRGPTCAELLINWLFLLWNRHWNLVTIWHLFKQRLKTSLILYCNYLNLILGEETSSLYQFF